MSSFIETECTRNITCPYCGWEDVDSWEAGDSDDECECAHCGETFSYERIITVEYTSWKKGASA